MQKKMEYIDELYKLLVKYYGNSPDEEGYRDRMYRLLFAQKQNK